MYQLNDPIVRIIELARTVLFSPFTNYQFHFGRYKPENAVKSVAVQYSTEGLISANVLPLPIHRSNLATAYFVYHQFEGTWTAPLHCSC